MAPVPSAVGGSRAYSVILILIIQGCNLNWCDIDRNSLWYSVGNFECFKPQKSRGKGSPPGLPLKNG